MSGNVFEWVHDWYQGNYYSTNPPSDPTGPDTGTYRVLRGGNYSNDAPVLRASYRGVNFPWVQGNAIGFRCVLDTDSSPMLPPHDVSLQNEIILPVGGSLEFTLLNADTVLVSDLLLTLPESLMLIDDFVPENVVLGQVYQAGDEVALAVKVDGSTLLSTSEYARVTQISALEWRIKFEYLPLGYSDWDYNDYVVKMVLNPVCDNDTDGFEDAYCGGTDCDDFDGAVYPGAPELCDGIDNNCFGDPGFGDVDEGCTATPSGMALVPSGCFDMGDPFNEGDADELPVHNVCLTSDFYMDVNEVTNSEYDACVRRGGCTDPIYTYSATRSLYYGDTAYSDFPMVNVTWFQASEYCTWVGKSLPSEAQWEYAARGGLSGQRYPWGNTILNTLANYNNSGDPWDNDTSQVGYYAANAYGLYDMAGKVWEWVNDYYQEPGDYYSISPTNDPTGPATGEYRIYRGGAFDGTTPSLRVAKRVYEWPTVHDYRVGFRCASD